MSNINEIILLELSLYSNPNRKSPVNKKAPWIVTPTDAAMNHLNTNYSRLGLNNNYTPQLGTRDIASLKFKIDKQAENIAKQPTAIRTPTAIHQHVGGYGVPPSMKYGDAWKKAKVGDITNNTQF